MKKKKMENTAADAAFQSGPETVLHKNLTLLETADAGEMDMIFASLKTGTLLVRIAPDAAVAMPEHADKLLEQLQKLGHTPKIREA